MVQLGIEPVCTVSLADGLCGFLLTWLICFRLRLIVYCYFAPMSSVFIFVFHPNLPSEKHSLKLENVSKPDSTFKNKICNKWVIDLNLLLYSLYYAKAVTSLRGPSPCHCARASLLLLKKRCSDDELLATLCPIWPTRDSNLSLQRRTRYRSTYWPVSE